MGKLKQTKLKHRKNKDSDENSDENSDINASSNNHTTKKYKILTSKNKNKLVLKEGRYYRKNDSINKKNKRSKKYLNMRTLDALKTHGSILKNQDGGFIINYLKFKWNMRKIKKIIDKLGKNQKDLNKFIDSYKKQPETFKRLGDNKAVVIYDILRSEKEKTIIEFLLQNKEEKTYDTSNMQHDLDMINTKIKITTTQQLKQLNEEIKNEKPRYEQNKKKFLKDSKQFEKLNEDYSKIMAFYVEQKELSDRYHSIAKDEHLTKQDKEIKNKYKKNEENIKYILSYKQEDISAINDNIKKIATLMNMSNDYDKKFNKLDTKEYDTDLQKWQGNYKAIYENISTIEEGIKSVSDTLTKIKEYADQIGSNLSTIYSAIKQNFKLDPILKIKRIIDENLGYLKNVKEVSLKKVKYAFIEQIPIEQIEIYLPLAEAALIQTEKSMNELNASFILDSSFIRSGHAGGGRWKGRRMSIGIDGVGGVKNMGGLENMYGVENMEGISNIGELEWFGNGGFKIFSYDELLKLNMYTFLDTDYKDITATLENMNNDLNDYDSDIFKRPNIDFFNIMKIYFNIYIYFEYYFNSRVDLNLGQNTNVFNLITADTNISENILDLVLIITKYENIIKDYRDVSFNDLPKTRQDEIKQHITNLRKHVFYYDSTGTPVGLVFRIKNVIKNDYFDKITLADNNIWNPFRQNDNLTLKNLYYEYNPHSATGGIELSCINSFMGYYTKTNTEITKYNEKDKCDFSKIKSFDKDALYNKYDDIPILYQDGAEYKFITIYYDHYDDKFKKNLNINIKKNHKSDEINDKFNDFIDFLSRPDQLNKNTAKLKTELKKDIYEAIEYINDLYDNLFCNDDSNNKFKDIINDDWKQYHLKICDDSLNSNHWSISFIKNAIIDNWRTIRCFNDDDTNDIQTLRPIGNPSNIGAPPLTNPVGAGPNNVPSGTGNNNLKFNLYVNNNKFIWLKKNIMPLILKNVYNNIDYHKDIQNYSVDRTQNYTHPQPTVQSHDTKLLNILKCKDKKDMYYIMLYKYKEHLNDIKQEIQTNDKMQKYLFTWLKSKCNQGVNELQTDNVSNFIYTLYENTSKTKTLLSDLDINNIDKNELYKAFNNTEQKQFKSLYNNFYTEAKKNLTELDKTALIIKEDKVVNTLSNPILPRTENRLVFDLPQALLFNSINQYNSNDFTKKTVLDIITKSYNKKGNYKNIPIKNIKRIVSFNVNNWNRSINYVKDINPNPVPPTLLLTDPKNAITFIKTKIPDTDVLCFLDYSLYTNDTAANRHIEAKVKSDDAIITVDNKYTEALIKNELKLDNYFIKNDNFDNVAKIPILKANDNMFLGKALYYDDKKTTISNPEPLCKTKEANDILYSEVLINKKPIGLYLINIYTPLDKIEIVELKKCIDKHTRTQNIYETVIMGTFTLKNTPLAYTKEELIDDMKTSSYNKFGNIKETCINNDPAYYYIDLCFVSDDFEKYFTILNDDIVVPSGSISTHYPIYLDIIENNDIDIEDDDFVVFYSEDNIVIDDKFMKFKFNLTLKKTPTVGGSKSSASSKPKPKYTPKIIKIATDGSYDIEMVDSSGNIIRDDRYKTATIDKITNIITIKDKNGKTSMIIDKGSRKITRFEEDGSIISTSVIDKDGIFLTKDKDGKEYKTKDGLDGKPETKDIYTGDVVKSYYDEEKDEVEKAKQEGKRLLSTFMDDINKENISTIVSKNKDSILIYIKKILDLIQTKLKHESYAKITSKLNALAKNIIELKTIEPKLTPDKVLIKDYDQKARSYDWMEDVTKREKVNLSLHDEAKQLETILYKHPEIKDILPSYSESITRENILDIISETDIRLEILNYPIKPHIQKIVDKLKNKDNVNTLIKFFEEKYRDIPHNMCAYLIAIIKISPSLLLSNKLDDIKCYEYSKNKKEKYQKRY